MATLLSAAAMMTSTATTLLSAATLASTAALLTLAGCEELSSDEAIGEGIQGTWTFSYDTSEELDMEFSYEHVIFRTDGTCALTYPDGQLEGTYRASEAVIAIDSEEFPNKEPMLWRITEFSPYAIVAQYILERGEGSVLITIRLERANE